jgi:hypothetical protein
MFNLNNTPSESYILKQNLKSLDKEIQILKNIIKSQELKIKFYECSLESIKNFLNDAINIKNKNINDQNIKFLPGQGD